MSAQVLYIMLTDSYIALQSDVLVNVEVNINLNTFEVLIYVT